MTRIKPFSKLLLLTLFLIPLNFIRAQTGWNYDASVYGWFAGINGTIGTANHQNQFEATLGELLENMTFTSGGHFEARNPKVTLILDLFYYGADKDAAARNVGDNTITPNVSIKLDEWIIEGSAGYKVQPNLDLLFSVRVIALGTDFVHDGANLTSVNKTWGVFYIGARYLNEFGKSWYGSVRGDVGYGGDGFAYFANASVGYRFSKLFSIALAYRIMNLNYNNGEAITYLKFDSTQHGFGLGFIFSF